MFYTIPKKVIPASDTLIEPESFWREVPTTVIDQFLPQSSPHRPKTILQLIHDGRAIHGRFEVADQFVRCIRTGYGNEVWKDSCVEFFVEPKPRSWLFQF